MASKGMKAISQATSDYRASTPQYSRRFVLKDGESADVIFLGSSSTEPFVSQEHAYRDKKIYDSILCNGEKCVCCHANTSGDRRVGRKAPKFNFSIYDLRWQKKVRDIKRSKEEGRDVNSYTYVDDEEVNERGIAKKIFLRSGSVGWSMPGQWATALDGINAQWERRCKSCGKGKISVIGYETSEGAPASKKAAKMSEDALQEAVLEGKLLEVLKCSRCEEPVRTNVFNSVVRISRTGDGKNTSYQFQLLPQEEVPEDVDRDEIEPQKWEEIKQPMSALAMADKLGVRNPFRGRTNTEAEDYDDEEDEEDDEDSEESPFEDDEDEDEDEEEDEEVKPKKKIAKKKTSRK